MASPSRRKQTETTKASAVPKSKSVSFRDGLQEYIVSYGPLRANLWQFTDSKSPEKFGRDRVVEYDDEFVLIRDM